MSNYGKLGQKEDFTRDIKFSKIGLNYIQIRLVDLYNENKVLFKDFISGKTLTAKRGISVESDIILGAFDDILPHKIEEVSITSFFQFNLDTLGNDIYGRYSVESNSLSIIYLPENETLFGLYSSSIPNMLKGDVYFSVDSSKLGGVNLACEELYMDISDLPVNCAVALFVDGGEYVAISSKGTKYDISEDCSFLEDVYSDCNSFVENGVVSSILVMLNEDERVSKVAFFTNSNNDISVVIH